MRFSISCIFTQPLHSYNTSISNELYILSDDLVHKRCTFVEKSTFLATTTVSFLHTRARQFVTRCTNASNSSSLFQIRHKTTRKKKLVEKTIRFQMICRGDSLFGVVNKRYSITKPSTIRYRTSRHGAWEKILRGRRLSVDVPHERSDRTFMRSSVLRAHVNSYDLHNYYYKYFRKHTHMNIILGIL